MPPPPPLPGGYRKRCARSFKTMAEPNGRTVRFAGRERFARIHREAGPSAPHVFLFHGSCAHSGQFLSIIEALKEQYNVFAMDYVGCGDSPKPNDWAAYSAEAFADDTVSFFREYAGKENMVFGHSSGSWRAMQLLAAEEGRISKVVLLGTGLDLPAPPTTIFLLPSFVLTWMQGAMTNQFIAAAIHESAPEELKQKEYAASMANPMHMVRAYYRQFEWGMRDCVENVKTPILVVQGRDDPITPLSGAEALVEALEARGNDRVRLAVVEKACHLVMQERPEDVLRAVLPFLREA